MLDFVSEVHISGLIFFLAIGYQISFYFIYLYYQNRKEKLGLNKLFLAYGLLFGIGLTGIVIRYVSNYYIAESEINEFFNSLTHCIIFISSLSFQLILASKDFNEILNTRITRIIAIYTTTITILLVFLELNVIKDLLILTSILIGFIFMLTFHFRLINNSTGDIKRRLIIITIGSGLMIIGILIGSNDMTSLFPPLIQDIILIIIIPLVSIGLLIIFFGAYNFPIFLEFNWQQNLIHLYIIDAKEQKALYSHDFSKLEITDQDDKSRSALLTRGIVGIDYVLSKVTDTQQESIKSIEHGEIFIRLEYSKNIIYALVVSREMESTSYFLKKIKDKFSDFYKNILNDLESVKGIEEEFFSSFDILLDNILNYK